MDGKGVIYKYIFRYLLGKMVENMKDVIKMIKNMVLVYFNGQMVEYNIYLFI